MMMIFSSVSLVYAPPEPSPEDDFRYSDHVLTGKIISSEIIVDPREDNPAMTFYNTVVYDVQVLEWHKNPLEQSVVTAYGTHFPNDVIPEPQWGIVEFEIGDTVYLYLDQTEQGLKFREYGSRLLPADDIEPFPSPCKSGPAPEGNFAFFDCNWVEIPPHWEFNNGQWQEDPSVLKLGPESDPVCPDVGVCTCTGKFNYYNSTDNRCYSSPYIPTSYQNACKQYAQLDFPGWDFNGHTCNWVSTSDPYENDESMRLASEKIDVGGLGINFSDYDGASTIMVGIIIGTGIAFSLLLYWRKRK